MIFPSARGLPGTVKIPNLYLQAGNLDVYLRIGYPIFPSVKTKLGIGVNIAAWGWGSERRCQNFKSPFAD